MFSKINSLLTRSAAAEGQALVEYAFILMLVATVCVAVLESIGQGVLGPLTTAANAL